jgi:hypothetical protein
VAGLDAAAAESGERKPEGPVRDEAPLLFGEQIGSDPVVVVQAQQLSALRLQLVHRVQ